MDINYNIETWKSSLRKMCIVSVTQNILEIARHHPSTNANPKSVASKAAEIVPELNLPQTLNTEIVAILRPVMKEMLRWYERYGEEVRVILTPHGTVDMTRSAKAIVASHLPVYQRFITACEHCLEDEIFTLGKQVTSVMLQERTNPLANFWYKIYGENFDAKIIRGSLSQEQVVEGWFLVGLDGNISALRYFQKKATLKSLQVILDRTWDSDYGFYSPKYISITPSLCNKCLHDKVFDDEWLEPRRDIISACLLLLLIKWPYQHLFLENAELLMPNLAEWDFWRIARNISKKLFADYKEYDYRSLFVRFWNLGLTNFKSKLLADSNIFVGSLLENLFLVKDEFLVSLVFDQISQIDENTLHLNYILYCACFCMFYEQKHEAVEFLMRLCRAKYPERFLKFQNEFNDVLIHIFPDVYCYSPCIQEKQKPFLDRFGKFMSKYWILPELEKSGKNDLLVMTIQN